MMELISISKMKKMLRCLRLDDIRMFSPYYYHRHGVKVSMKFINKLWWRFVPGTTIKVTWPVGWVVLDEHADGSKVSTESADPNDHYRPWMEQNVGRQRWDWDWTMMDDDINQNRLTIKFRRGKEQWASYFRLRWA